MVVTVIVRERGQEEDMTIDLCDTEEQFESVTVGQLREKIKDRLRHQGGTELVRRLVFENKTLDGDSTLLSEHGVQHMSVIHMEGCPSGAMGMVGTAMGVVAVAGTAVGLIVAAGKAGGAMGGAARGARGMMRVAGTAMEVAGTAGTATGVAGTAMGMATGVAAGTAMGGAARGAMGVAGTAMGVAAGGAILWFIFKGDKKSKSRSMERLDDF